MNKPAKVSIPSLEGIYELPVTFRLLTQVPVSQYHSKNLYILINAYQGFALAEPMEKPYSKIIDWGALL
jgi:hypothetical protein